MKKIYLTFLIAAFASAAWAQDTPKKPSFAGFVSNGFWDNWEISVGAAIPLGILYVLYNRAITYILTKFSLLNNILDFLPVGQVYKTLLPVGLLLGIGIGFVGSFFTIRKHLRV